MAYQNQNTATNTLTWVCNTCHRPVADDAGYIHIDMRAVNRAQQASRQWNQNLTDRGAWQPVNLGTLMALPGPAHWLIHHSTCDPEPDSPDYHFTVDRAHTHAQLLAWTAHLMGKTWLEHTDWSELIRVAAGVDP